jgi:hypothetical protein
VDKGEARKEAPHMAELKTFRLYRRPGSNFLRPNGFNERTVLNDLGYRGIVSEGSVSRLAENLHRLGYDILILQQYGHAKEIFDLRTGDHAHLGAA